jgi:hypothetical protein
VKQPTGGVAGARASTLQSVAALLDRPILAEDDELAAASAALTRVSE